MSVDVEIHTLEVALDDSTSEVSHRASRVGLDSCLRVLYHEQSVFVVGIRDSEGIFVQTVEEDFLGIAVILNSLMIVEMVACQVGEKSSGELQTTNAFLGNGVTRAFHEGIFTAGIHHLCQQLIQFNGVRGGMVGGDGLIFYIVAYRGE